ncbi:MAG: YjbQ family protein, partial [Actinomycetota bacterium]|nr:YjbQ family protein [Actinomycetota bacterium]
IYAHRHGSVGHGADHVIPAFISPAVTVPVVEGQVALGRWQSIVFVDLNRDNPERNVRFSFLGG